jgi:hypothetical protein
MTCILTASDLHAPKSGGRILLPNAGSFLSNYMTSYPQNAVKFEYDERQGKVHRATGTMCQSGSTDKTQLFL